MAENTSPSLRHDLCCPQGWDHGYRQVYCAMHNTPTMNYLYATKVPQPGRPPAYAKDELRSQSVWIRDKLDPIVAREGWSCLAADTIQELSDFLSGLQKISLTLDDLYYSRIHKAVGDMAARATRWPTALVHLCDTLIERWEKQFGPLKNIGTPLYGPGGRLCGVCKPGDKDREVFERYAARRHWLTFRRHSWLDG